MFRVLCENTACANTFELDFPLGNQKIPCPYCGAALIATEPSNLPVGGRVPRGNRDPVRVTEPPKEDVAIQDDASQLLDEWLRTLEAEAVIPPRKPAARSSTKPAPKSAPRAKTPVAKPAPPSKADEPEQHIHLRDLVEGGHITVDEQSEFLKIMPCPNPKCRKPMRIRRGRGVRLALCPHCGQAVTIGHSD